MHGFDIDPHDIDIITDELGAFYLNNILSAYCIVPIKKRGDSEQFDSLLGSFVINGSYLEIMGNFRFKSCNDQLWYCFDDMFDLVEEIVVDGVEIPVVSLHGLIDIYQKMGRKKDLAKLALIQRRNEAYCRAYATENARKVL